MQLERTRSGAVSGELGRLRTLVDDGIRVLTDAREPLSCFGELLNTAWTMKRALSPRISSDRIDGWYDQARAEGAVGGKLLGAGGGGFLLLLVPPDRSRIALLRALPDFAPCPVRVRSHGDNRSMPV